MLLKCNVQSWNNTNIISGNKIDGGAAIFIDDSSITTLAIVR